ncbi:outer membrane protein transport protein [Allorhizobium sp. BGMRC 0089]|uniref:OmpP1/FadL family transporter n=1 Tax=Allorhizobium sonneratiae TaxID=2934936 RepID=UPI00203453BD|nr:outer membrane protein transport protein [Allorhizobium sonneratiae]MCM2293664.1 outer membrane protein transport protein [Allorhizobium sonneratiae]
MRTGFLSLAVLTACVTGANAGGFSMGEADTDILYQDGTVISGGVIYVKPQVKYKTISGVKATDGAFSDDFAIPSFAAKTQIFDPLGCAFTYTQPFGGSSNYGAQAQAADHAVPTAPNYYSKKKFTTNEYGLTCALHFDAGPGRLFLIGGGFIQDFDYNAYSYYGNLHLKDDGSLGYRLGVGYDIPQYAMRAQLMYRSAVKQKTDGDFTPIALAGFIGSSAVSANGTGTLPQSVKLSLQSGIAPDWLVYGSVKWTDWSVLQTLDYNITYLGAQHDAYYWKDGWTVQTGVGHKFSEKVSGTVNVTWDKGVSSGADIWTDTWTLGAGALVKLGPGELKLGGAVSYISGGSQYIVDGANFNATTGTNWAYSLGGGYSIKF